VPQLRLRDFVKCRPCDFWILDSGLCQVSPMRLLDSVWGAASATSGFWILDELHLCLCPGTIRRSSRPQGDCIRVFTLARSVDRPGHKAIASVYSPWLDPSIVQATRCGRTQQPYSKVPMVGKRFRWAGAALRQGTTYIYSGFRPIVILKV
jgi:hypothetical protein